MLFAIGKKVEVYDNRDNVRDWKTAVIESVRTQVKSSFDSHIYPLLYDVKFLHDSHHSKGHLPFAVRQIEQCTVRRSGLIMRNKRGANKMRDIKFRAWHQGGTMSDWDALQNHSMHFIFGYGTLNLMQYTGLKDKNGKEIYEGDLLRINPHDEEIYIARVETVEGSPFCIETPWDGESDYFMLAAYVRHFGNVEVIGNIHENPELLTA